MGASSDAGQGPGGAGGRLVDEGGPLGDFLEQLSNRGDILLASREPPTPEERVGAVGPLRAWDRQERDRLGHPLPSLREEDALAALVVLYRACQLLVYRDLPEEAVAEAFAEAPPPSTEPEAVWSVDLSYRYLPDLARLAVGLSPGDPLVAAIREQAARWPFSSVGMEAGAAGGIDSVLVHPGLRRIFLDRVVAAGDRGRAGRPEVAFLLREEAGAYAELLTPLGIQRDEVDEEESLEGMT